MNREVVHRIGHACIGASAKRIRPGSIDLIESLLSAQNIYILNILGGEVGSGEGVQGLRVGSVG